MNRSFASRLCCRFWKRNKRVGDQHHNHNTPAFTLTTSLQNLAWPDSRSIARKKGSSRSSIPGGSNVQPSPLFRFGLRLHLAECRVIKVYDGDSLTIAWRQESGMGAGSAGASSAGSAGSENVFLYANCRMYGIDTPEMNSKVEKQKSMAGECKRFMMDLLLDERMLMTTIGVTGLDKYGRPLIELHVDPRHTSERCKTILHGYQSVNAWALSNLPGCKPYFGGTKDPEEEQEQIQGEP